MCVDYGLAGLEAVSRYEDRTRPTTYQKNFQSYRDSYRRCGIVQRIVSNVGNKLSDDFLEVHWNTSSI